jgi:aerobic-type carbon monoxide dehydrogenase small subunit (CoxS/CutS family)
LNGTGETRLTKAVSRGRRIEFTVDGVAVEAFEGESVAAALLAAGRRRLRETGRRSEPRGFYCGIGLCFECAMVVDGRRVRTCVTPVRDGMRVGAAQDDSASVTQGGAR